MSGNDGAGSKGALCVEVPEGEAPLGSTHRILLSTGPAAPLERQKSP
jgi:hypothetical protein